MSEITTTSFDYGQLCNEDRVFVRDAAEDIRHRCRQTIEHVIAIGGRLTEVKARLTHGQFGRWLHDEFRWSERSAQRFMNAHKEFGNSNPPTLADLTRYLEPSGVYELAAPSAPETAKQEVLAKVERGERVSTKEVKAAVRRHKAATRGGKRPAPAPKEKPGRGPVSLMMVAVVTLNAELTPAAVDIVATMLTEGQRATLRQHIPDLIRKLRRLLDPIVVVEVEVDPAVVEQTLEQIVEPTAEPAAEPAVEPDLANGETQSEVRISRRTGKPVRNYTRRKATTATTNVEAVH